MAMDKRNGFFVQIARILSEVFVQKEAAVFRLSIECRTGSLYDGF